MHCCRVWLGSAVALNSKCVCWHLLIPVLFLSSTNKPHGFIHWYKGVIATFWGKRTALTGARSGARACGCGSCCIPSSLGPCTATGSLAGTLWCQVHPWAQEVVQGLRNEPAVRWLSHCAFPDTGSIPLLPCQTTPSSLQQEWLLVFVMFCVQIAHAAGVWQWLEGETLGLTRQLIDLVSWAWPCLSRSVHKLCSQLLSKMPTVDLGTWALLRV